MRKHRITWITGIALAAVVLSLGACSILGLAIGAKTPRKYDFNRPWPVYRLDSLPDKATVYVYHRGKVTYGKFSKVIQKGLPGAEARLLVVNSDLPNATSVRSEILFTEIDSVLVHERIKLFKGEEWESGWEIVQIPRRTKIAVYKKNGAVVKGKFLGNAKTEADSCKNCPKIKVKKADEQTVALIPVSDINYVICTGNTNQALKGFLTGLTVDVTVVLVGVYAVNHMFDNLMIFSTSSANSCPYVYSFDGKQYRFENEMIVGSIFQKDQRTDLSRLDHLTPTADRCQLRITNELRETEYIDQLSLLAVDHPLGSRVVPSGDGSIWALNHILAPRKVTDMAGAEWTEDVAQPDNQAWFSNPFGRNLDDPRDLREALLLEFDRPAAADTATLMLRLMNTSWSVAAQAQLLGLLGRDLDSWYAQMEQSSEARQALTAAMLREIMLHVSVWNGSRWQPVRYVWETGAVAQKEVAVQILLQGIPRQEMLKIRLDCPPATWLVDQAAVDYHALPVRAQAVPLVRANDGSGKDIASLLHTSDGRHYEMPNLYQYADLEFALPVREAGKARSYLVQCTGYYRPIVQRTGEPQTETVNRLLQEPGAFNRHALQNLYDAMAARALQ